MASSDATLPEASRALLERVRSTGLSDQAVHDAVGLPSGWLSKARRGAREPGAPGWAKLRAWLDRYERRALPPGSPSPAPGPPISSPFAGPGAAPAAPAGPSVPSDLADAIDRAKTSDDLIEALRRVSLAGVRGSIDKAVGTLALNLAKETRLVLERLATKEGSANTIRDAVDVLSPRERAFVDALRAALTGPGLKPGETPAPAPSAGTPLPPPPRIVALSAEEGHGWEIVLVAAPKAAPALAALRAVATS